MHYQQEAVAARVAAWHKIIHLVGGEMRARQSESKNRPMHDPEL